MPDFKPLKKVEKTSGGNMEIWKKLKKPVVDFKPNPKTSSKPVPKPVVPKPANDPDRLIVKIAPPMFGYPGCLGKTHVV